MPKFLDLLIPSHRNNFRAHLIKIPSLAMITLTLLTFNLFARGSIIAQDYSKTISVENIIDQHNKIREASGISSLKLNPILSSSALEKANQMMQSNCWSHYCPPGVDPWSFFENVGYKYTYAGENLAEGFTAIDDLMNAWINSKSHKENILKKEFVEIGVAIVQGDYQDRKGNILVVVHFATPYTLITSSNDNKIQIFSPEPNEVVNNKYVNVNGKAKGFSKVSIFNNGELEGSANIIEDIFTFRIENPIQGKNIVKVVGEANSDRMTESIVEFSVNIPKDSTPQLIISGQSTLGVSISPEVQKYINFGFIVLLLGLFLVDFLVLRKTSPLEHKRSFSHYHFSILLILSIIILIGGFAGNVI